MATAVEKAERVDGSVRDKEVAVSERVLYGGAAVFPQKRSGVGIVAHVVDPAAFNAMDIGFENHLNVFHSDKRGIDCDVGLRSERVPEFNGGR